MKEQIKRLIPYIIVGVLAITIIFLVFNGIDLYEAKKDRRELIQENDELRKKLTNSNTKLDSLKACIVIYNKQYFELLKSKSNIKIIYDTKLQEVDNRNVVSNDSITKYIASKLHSGRERVHSIYTFGK